MSTPRRSITVTVHPDTLRLLDRMRATALLSGNTPDISRGNAIDMAFMLWAIYTGFGTPEDRDRYMELLRKWGILTTTVGQ